MPQEEQQLLSAVSSLRQSAEVLNATADLVEKLGRLQEGLTPPGRRVSSGEIGPNMSGQAPETGPPEGPVDVQRGREARRTSRGARALARLRAV